ncbi:MAG: hypothetical protein DI547_04065 [Sphingobium sp.]|nr:MAG: hypothetical protein DI547_04065 [Sphingobium sp.]
MKDYAGRRLPLISVGPLLWLAACSGGSDTAVENKAEPAPTPVIKPVDAPAPAAKPFSLEEDGKALQFGYSYPAEAAAVPEIAARLDGEMRKTRADALNDAEADRKEREKGDLPFMPHALETHWTVQGNTPRFLSLLSETYVFTGGAHGMTGYGGLLWDRETQHAVALSDVATSTAAFGKAITGRFCAALDKEREKKRGEPVVRTGEDDFTACINPLEQTLVPVSKDGKALDSLLVVVGPYAAGPYAEGSYEISLPVDAAMLDAIKPAYRPAFSAGR